MLNRSNSLNIQIHKNKDVLLSNLNKFKKIHIKRDVTSGLKLPNIKKIKSCIQNTDLPSLNNNIETTNSSHNVKSISSRKFIPLLKSSIKKLDAQTDKTNRVLPRKLKIKKIFNLKHSSSIESLISENIPSVSSFHKKIMEQNERSCQRRLKEEYIKYKNGIRDKEQISEMLNDRRSTKKLKTGIYGPENNIVSIIRSRMERLKLDNEYRGVKEEVKELIKDEILDAQVKLKMKPINLIRKKEEKKPLFKTKLDRYRYLEKMNLLSEINQTAVTPMVVNDGNMMIQLINDAFRYFKMDINI